MTHNGHALKRAEQGSADVTGQWEIPARWTWQKLGDVADLLDHRRVPVNAKERAVRCEGKQPANLFPYYGATGQVGWIDGYLFDEESVLLGEDGAPFLDRNKPKAYYVSGRYWVNNHAHILKAKTGIELRWLLHALNWVNYEEFVGGTTRLKLTQADLVKLPIPIAPLAEQYRIVARIDELFTDIAEGEAALERARRDLYTWRRALLKAAVTGDLTRDWRQANNPTETGGDLLARLRSDPRHKSGERGAANNTVVPLFEICAEWTWGTIGDLVSSIDYGTSQKCHSEVIGIPVLRMGNIQDGELDLRSLKRTARENVEGLLLVKGDLLFNRTNSAELVGKTAIYRGQPSHCSFASYLVRLRVRGCNPEYINAWLNSAYARAWVAENKSQQVGQANLSAGKLRNMPVPIPPLAEQQQIVRTIQSQCEMAEAGRLLTTRSEHESSALRQAVLKAAFEGRLVPQDPADEPASVLLSGMREGSTATGAIPGPRRRPRDRGQEAVAR